MRHRSRATRLQQSLRESGPLRGVGDVGGDEHPLSGAGAAEDLP